MSTRRLHLFVCLVFLAAAACGTDDPKKGNNGSNNSTTSTNGDTNGSTNGDTNGSTNGDTNGSTNGDTNGSTNGDTNGSTNGDTNGSTNSSTNNGTGGTNNTNNGTGGTNNTNNMTTGPSCAFEGDTCTVGDPVNAGFVCVDDTCYIECDPTADPSECRAGAACVPDGANGPTYCQPSDCNGWLDTTSCNAGDKCVAAGNGAFLCVAEGAGADGDTCAAPGDCAAGLFCGFGECQPLCGADTDCDQAGGEICVGANDPGVLDVGIGLCEVGCDSYSTGQCPAGQGCFPVTSEDGICDDVGTTAQYQACTDAADCGENTTCITFQAEDAAAGIPMVGRCLPFCDASAFSQTAANATCPTGGHCLDLSDGDPTPQSGVCLEACADSDAYGTGACSGPSDYCAPRAVDDTHLCFPGGPNTAGDVCDPDDSTDGCDGTSFCQQLGDGTGMCEPYCQPVTQSNANLGCDTGESCRQVGDDALNVGRCEVECTPEADFADTTCPANLQTCHPPAASEQAYCSASGSTAVGGTCEVFASSCLAGDSCVNTFGRDLSGADPFADGTCAPSCSTFGDGSECGANEVCSLNWLTLNTAVGHCTQPDVDPNGCTADFQICDDHSTCLDTGAGSECVELCDLDNDQCASGVCTQLFQSATISVGGCL